MLRICAKHRNAARIIVVSSQLLQNLIKRVPAYVTAMPVLAKCNLEGNPVEHLDSGMTATLTQFNLRSASEMVTETWRHHEQVAAAVMLCWGGCVSRCRCITPLLALRIVISICAQGNRPPAL